MKGVKIIEKQDGPYTVRLIQEARGEGHNVTVQVSRPREKKQSDGVWDRFLNAVGVTID